MTPVNCNSYYSVTSLTGRKLNGSLQSILCHKTLKLYNNHKKIQITDFLIKVYI